MNNSNQQDDLIRVFGENQGYWKYTTIDDEFICYAVRYPDPQKDKIIVPYSYYGEKLQRGMNGSTFKPIYNLPSLKKFPDQPVMIVEGEKTADAGITYFPQFNVITWMGGTSSADKPDWSILSGKIVYLIPDNDKVGYEAMEKIKNILLHVAEKVYFINIKNLGVRKKWDIANINDDDNNVELELLEKFISETKPCKLVPSILDKESFPNLSDNPKNPRPLDTAENHKFLFNHYSINVRWNLMSRSWEIKVPNHEFYEEEKENATLNYITDLAVLNSLPNRRTSKHLDAISWENRFHPVRDWILSKSLEQTNRGILNKFLQTVKTTNDDLSHKLIKRWMISAIAAVFNDTDFCAQGVLVLQGPTGFHKSTFIMDLAPDSLQAIKGSLTLDPTKKDDIFTSAEYWIAELGELDATFKKADIARLKSHITNAKDVVRRPHAVRNSKMIRRSVYAATVNESKYLIDTTGNRRWWTISIVEAIKTRHGLDMQQIWRELYDLWTAGEKPVLSADELAELNKLNENFEYIDPFTEKLDVYFDWSRPSLTWMNSTQVLAAIGYEKPSKGDCTRMGSILTKRKLIKGTGRLERSYQMPWLNTNIEKEHVL